MRKRYIVIPIAIITSSLLMTACGNKSETVSAMSNNVLTETSSNHETETQAQTQIQDETEMQTQSATESTIETETGTSSVVGDEKETTESTETDESNAIGDIGIEEYKAGDAESGAYTITDMDVTMYATQQCNIRKEPSIQDDIIGSLLQTQGIQVTGKVNEVNWYRICLPDGTEGYISSALLSPTQPSVQISTPTPSTQQEAATQAEQPLTPDQVINPLTGQPYKVGDVDKNGITYIGVLD